MRKLTAALLCLGLAACAAAEPVPNARLLSQENVTALGATKLSATGNETGVGKSWYYTQTNGGGSLVGALAAAVAAAIINYAPSARAHRQADEVAKFETPEALDASMTAKLKAEAAKTGAGVTFSEVVLTQKAMTPGDLDDVLEVSTTYTLSEDSSVLKIVAQATYQNKAIPYKSPYTFKSSIPESEKKGPLYRNTFTYYSKPLPAPALTPELKQRMVAAIEESVRDESGAPPKPGSSEEKSMQREIELAKDDKLTPAEISLFLTREWLKDDGAMIKKEVERAHDFIARYVMLDINRVNIPSLTGVDELLETAADERTVRRVGSGVEAGSYVCSPAGVVDFATYGNTVAVSKASVEYVKGLKAQAPKAKKS